MDDAKRLALINAVVTTQLDNNNDDDGDKFLSNADLAMEVIANVIDADGPAGDVLVQRYNEGWFGEMKLSS